jgi:mycothiol synthase
MQVQELSTLTNVSIRPFETTDYAAITAVHNANFSPEFTYEEHEFKFDDEHRPEHCRHARWVAEVDGRIVGFGQYDQNAYLYDPRKFQFGITVVPDFHGRGIGGQLYDLIIGEVQRFDPISADEWSREDMDWRVGFLERRGFVADFRMWTSVLDLNTFDPARFAESTPDHLQIRTLAELGAKDDAVWRRIYDMWCEVRHDVPLPPDEARVEVSFEQFREREDRPGLWPAGYFLALDGDRYVGTSQLWLAPESDTLRTGLTGVRRAYRRQGIATALKVRALALGKAQGYRRVNTENASHNVGMLGINMALGFVKNPAWVHFVKSFGG